MRKLDLRRPTRVMLIFTCICLFVLMKLVGRNDLSRRGRTSRETEDKDEKFDIVKTDLSRRGSTSKEAEDKDEKFTLKVNALLQQLSGYNSSGMSPGQLERIRRFLQYARHDVILEKPPTFLTHYKNPCYFENTGDSSDETKLRCLPYFMLIGVTKCATSQLYVRIQRHPDIVLASKEPRFWPRVRHCNKDQLKHLYKPNYRHPLFGRNLLQACLSKFMLACENPAKRAKCEGMPDTLPKYVDYYDELASHITKLSESHSTEKKMYASQIITGDGTPDTIWDNKGWYDYKINENDFEGPALLNAHYIKHFIPQVKLIVALRNPVDRALSDFGMISRLRNTELSPERFHSEVLREINFFNECWKKHDIRYCVYHSFSEKVSRITNVRLHAGFYNIFLEDWFQIFPREQFHIIRLGDFSMFEKNTMQGIYRFLGLRDVDLGYSNTGIIRKSDKNGLMWNETRVILQNFYQPHIQSLARLLNDERFLWN